MCAQSTKQSSMNVLKRAYSFKTCKLPIAKCQQLFWCRDCPLWSPPNVRWSSPSWLCIVTVVYSRSLSKETRSTFSGSPRDTSPNRPSQGPWDMKMREMVFLVLGQSSSGPPCSRLQWVQLDMIAGWLVVRFKLTNFWILVWHCLFHWGSDRQLRVEEKPKPTYLAVFQERKVSKRCKDAKMCCLDWEVVSLISVRFNSWTNSGTTFRRWRN